jgi:hypothetical protein
MTTGASTLGASHAQHIELADEIAEYDRSVAGKIPRAEILAPQSLRYHSHR